MKKIKTLVTIAVFGLLLLLNVAALPYSGQCYDGLYKADTLCAEAAADVQNLSEDAIVQTAANVATAGTTRVHFRAPNDRIWISGGTRAHAWSRNNANLFLGPVGWGSGWLSLDVPVNVYAEPFSIVFFSIDGQSFEANITNSRDVFVDPFVSGPASSMLAQQTRVFFYNRGGWGLPRAHAWIDGGPNLLGAWNTSQQSMTRESIHTNWWYIDVPVHAYHNPFYIIVYNSANDWYRAGQRQRISGRHNYVYITWLGYQEGSLSRSRTLAQGYRKVFFYNRGRWNQPRAHAWIPGGQNLLGAWNTPQQNMRRYGTTNWWYARVPSVTAAFNIIVYNSANDWYRAGTQFVSPLWSGQYITWTRYQDGSMHGSRREAMGLSA